VAEPGDEERAAAARVLAGALAEAGHAALAKLVKDGPEGVTLAGMSPAQTRELAALISPL
jgi:hypothetical protein